MFTGPEMVAELEALDITHVVWLPDSALGPWEAAIEASPRLQLVRVCREAEAWAVAGGLLIGGQRPVVVIQTTGMLDSGDAIRNFVFDMELPLFAIVGYRSYLIPNSTDSAKRFAEPILNAWGLPYIVLTAKDQLPELSAHYRACRTANQAGVALIGEGRS